MVADLLIPKGYQLVASTTDFYILEKKSEDIQAISIFEPHALTE